MKKLFAAAALLCLLQTSFAQGLDFGIKAGVNAAKIDNTNFKDGFNYGFLAGAFLHLNVSKKFGVGADVLFSQAAAKPANGLNSVSNSLNFDSLKSIKLNYLGVPVYLNMGGKFKIQLGAQFNIKMNESESIWNNGQGIFKSNDLQALAGFQWNLPLHLFVSGRYLVGFTDLNDLTNQDTWKSQTIQVAAGFRF